MKTLSAFLLLALGAGAIAATTIDATNKYAWGANFGWINWADANGGADGAVIGEYVCSGYVWAANVGWINLGDGTPTNGVAYSNTIGTDFGVNHDGAGALRGLAYGANIGWINFHNTGDPRVDLATGQLSGFAWSANCGWINLGTFTQSVATGVIAMGADTDSDGISDAWEMDLVGNLTTLTATGDADGDGESDVDEYLADTDPLDPGFKLAIAQQVIAGDFSTITLTWPSVPTRRYRIEENVDLVSSWTTALDNIVPDAGTETTRPVSIPGPTPEKRFYRVIGFRPLAQ